MARQADQKGNNELREGGGILKTLFSSWSTVITEIFACDLISFILYFRLKVRK